MCVCVCVCVCVCACALTPRPEDHAPVAPRACPPLRSCRGPAVTPISAQVLIPACRDGHSAATPLSCHLGILPPPVSCMALYIGRFHSSFPPPFPSPTRPDVHTDILGLRGLYGHCIVHCCGARGYGLEFFFQTPHYHAMLRCRAPAPDISHRSISYIAAVREAMA